MGGRVRGVAATPLLLVSCIDGRLEFGEQVRIHVLRYVGWNLGTSHVRSRRRSSRSRKWILIVFLEPLNEFVDIPQHLVPVSVSIHGHSHILDSGPGTRLVSETELSRSLLGRAEEVRYSLWVFALFFSEELFESFWVSTVRLPVALVAEHLSSTCSYRLDVSC